MSHNTVDVDGRSQALPAGPFHWATRADARLDGWLHSSGFDWAEGSHDGYAPVLHRRTLLRTAESGWLVVDELLGEGRHGAEAHWHFHPAWMLRYDAPGRLRATHIEGGEAWLLHDAGDVRLARGDEASGLGWYAPTYGTLLPTWAARVSQQAAAPFAMVTWIGGARIPLTARTGVVSGFSQTVNAPPAMERVVPTCDGVHTAIGVRVMAGPHASIFLLQPGGPHPHTTRGCEILDYHTDARVFHCQEEGGRLTRLDLIGASHARALRRGGFTIVASQTMTNLHVTVQDGVLDLQASAPPSGLRVEGDVVSGLRTVRLNHRDLQTPTSDRADVLLVSGADWPS